MESSPGSISLKIMILLRKFTVINVNFNRKVKTRLGCTLKTTLNHSNANNVTLPQIQEIISVYTDIFIKLKLYPTLCIFVQHALTQSLHWIRNFNVTIAISFSIKSAPIEKEKEEEFLRDGNVYLVRSSQGSMQMLHHSFFHP